MGSGESCEVKAMIWAECPKAVNDNGSLRHGPKVFSTSLLFLFLFLFSSFLSIFLTVHDLCGQILAQTLHLEKALQFNRHLSGRFLSAKGRKRTSPSLHTPLSPPKSSSLHHQFPRTLRRGASGVTKRND